MTEIYVGMSTCGLSAGARDTFDKLAKLCAAGGGELHPVITGCLGMCYAEPLVEVRSEEERVVYGEVSPKRAEEIFERHLRGGQVLEDYVVLREKRGGRAERGEGGARAGREAAFIDSQQRIVLRHCGLVNPEDIEDYERVGGYQALRRALFQMKPQEVIEVVRASGLRGRGGAGFPTGIKWGFVAKNQADVKYLVCNADEGDPGAFMDRSVLEGDPHAVLEGMVICAYAVGATHGYIYCRAEYPLALKRLAVALKQMREKGYLGQRILGSTQDFEVKIKQGAGAFVCGEETALFASIEGERGMPRIRPPFPAEKGLWGKPTNNNNVETYANIPWIVLNGAEAYRRFGTEKSPGTKVFALAGKVKHGGLAEVSMGLSIRDLVFNVGGGIREDKRFKAVQIGGPSGGCIPAELGDTPVDFENIPRTGAIMGSGGMVVLDETTCMVDIARFFLDFTQAESCGKCTFCRIGTLRMLEILERITRGEGQEGDIEKLQQLAAQIKEASLCGLGQTAPNPVLTTIKYYRSEYEAHIRDKKCPAKSCTALVDYFINPELCSGCALCVKACSVGAIIGEPKKPHSIDREKCAKCGKCIATCNLNAIYKDCL